MYDNVTGKAVITPKSYGRTIKPSDLPDGFTKFFPLASTTTTDPTSSDSPVPSGGLPRHLLLPILYGIRDDIKAKRGAFEQIHLRMPGESILIAYEAEWARAEEALKAQEARKQATVAIEQSDAADSAILVQELDGEGDDDTATADDEDDEAGDDDDDDDDETSSPQLGPAYVVKLIDFAHTRLKPGEGPDEGALVGLNTILQLLDGRIAQVEAALS